jgi:hypothetical protein
MAVTAAVPFPRGRGGHYGLAVPFAMIPLAVAVAVVRYELSRHEAEEPSQLRSSALSAESLQKSASRVGFL